MSSVSKTIAIGSDHGGFEMKEFIRKKLVAAGWDVKDFGTDSTQSVDYPDIIHPIASAVNGGVYEKAIILCGSGNGAQMTANKYPHVRAALCWNQEQASLSRQHNDANVLSLPGRFIGFDVAWEMVLLFLNTAFEGGRHQVRVDKISKTI